LRLGAFDELGDLRCGRLGPLGQAPDLIGDYSEAATGVTGAGGFDGGVEGEQVGLVGDVVDQIEDALDLVDATGKREGAVAGSPEVGLGELEVRLRLAGLDGDLV